jgi:hypothetical protein
VADNGQECPIISVHFPKAGGSALAAQLQAAYGAGQVLTSYDCDPTDPANPFWWNRRWFLKNRPLSIQPYAVVHGHIPIAKYDLIPRAKRLVMLREPVANIISIYFHWQRLIENGSTGHAIFEFVKTKRLTLLETAEIPKLRWLMTQTYFGDYDMRRFDLIGAHERRPTFMRAVSGLIGKSLSPDEKANVTPPTARRGDIMNDARVLAQLRVRLEDDIRFYDVHTRRL